MQLCGALFWHFMKILTNIFNLHPLKQLIFAYFCIFKIKTHVNQNIGQNVNEMSKKSAPRSCIIHYLQSLKRLFINVWYLFLAYSLFYSLHFQEYQFLMYVLLLILSSLVMFCPNLVFLSFFLQASCDIFFFFCLFR